MRGEWFLFGLVALLITGGLGVFALVRPRRMERRRRRSHNPVVTKASNRPMVRFSVRPPKR